MIIPLQILANHGFNHGIISWCEMDFATIHSITDITGKCMPFIPLNVESSPDGMLGLQVANLDGPGIAQHPVPGEIRAVGSNALGFYVAGCHSKARKLRTAGLIIKCTPPREPSKMNLPKKSELKHMKQTNKRKKQQQKQQNQQNQQTQTCGEACSAQLRGLQAAHSGWRGTSQRNMRHSLLRWGGVGWGGVGWGGGVGTKCFRGVKRTFL